MTQAIETPAEMICFALYSAQNAMGRIYRPLLDPLGLTYPQYLVLLAIGAQKACSLRDLRAEIALETNTLTPLLKRMQQAGLLTRRRNPNDERELLLELTEKGLQLRQQAMQTQGCIFAACGIAEDRLADLHRQISELRDHLEAAGRAS